jgi:hypothetical protein
MRPLLQFFRRHWIPVICAVALVTGIAALLVAQSVRVAPKQFYGNNPNVLVNPGGSLEGSDFQPSPGDIFAPSDPTADTYPGFPPGTRFLSGLVRDRLTVVSEGVALRFWARYKLQPHCTLKIHRYVDPERQTLARATIGGCDIFIAKSVQIPKYRRSWNAMGYCNLIVHETGHSIGLLHSPNPADIMYFTGNSRARTGCERFAPTAYGTARLTDVPTSVTCSGEQATRYWLSGDYARAIRYVQTHPGPDHCP